MSERARAARQLLGWREWLALPDLGIRAIRAKLDSGARSSSLHVDEIEAFSHEGLEWVRFTVGTGAHDQQLIQAQVRVHDRRPVTDSGGHTTERIFIRTAVRLSGAQFECEINLTSRRNMLFPMLLGRTALARRFLIHPGRSFILGKQPPAPQATP